MILLHDLNKLEKSTPNDSDFGAKIRKIIRELIKAQDEKVYLTILKVEDDDKDIK